MRRARINTAIFGVVILLSLILPAASQDVTPFPAEPEGRLSEK